MIQVAMDIRATARHILTFSQAGTVQPGLTVYSVASTLPYYFQCPQNLPRAN